MCLEKLVSSKPFEITEIPDTPSWKLKSQLNALEEATWFASLEN